MLKKILIVFALIGVLAVAFIGYGTYKVAEEKLQENEPLLRQYMQMTQEQQNQYILENAKELISQRMLSEDMDAEERAGLELMEKTKDDPAVQKALVELGRSLLAAAIVHSEPLIKDMSANLKAQYEEEYDQLKIRLETYGEILEQMQSKHQ